MLSERTRPSAARSSTTTPSGISSPDGGHLYVHDRDDEAVPLMQPEVVAHLLARQGWRAAKLHHPTTDSATFDRCWGSRGSCVVFGNGPP